MWNAWFVPWWYAQNYHTSNTIYALTQCSYVIFHAVQQGVKLQSRPRHPSSFRKIWNLAHGWPLNWFHAMCATRNILLNIMWFPVNSNVTKGNPKPHCAQYLPVSLFMPLLDLINISHRNDIPSIFDFYLNSGDTIALISITCHGNTM